MTKKLLTALFAFAFIGSLTACLPASTDTDDVDTTVEVADEVVTEEANEVEDVVVEAAEDVTEEVTADDSEITDEVEATEVEADDAKEVTE